MLFGHQDNVNRSDTATPSVPSYETPQSATPGVNPLAVDPDTGASLPVVPAGSPGPVDTTPAVDTVSEPSVLDQPASPSQSGSVVSPTVDSGSPFSADPDPVVAPQDETVPVAALDDAPAADTNAIFSPEPAAEPAAQTSPALGTAIIGGQIPGSNDLLDLKQQVISQLSPLVRHLEQSPEEKFRTTMMLIQSTDNPTLLQDAYNSAQAIGDEKVRAQALLDVVNEINYFTQRDNQTA